MRIDAKKLISETDIVNIIGRHVTLKKNGPEHEGICPFHSDKRMSLKVNKEKNIYSCFSCGIKGGDSIDFLMRNGSTFHEACEELKGDIVNHGSNPELRSSLENKPKPNSWKHVSPAPRAASDFYHYRHGLPSKTWAYHDKFGKIVGYACRFDFADGEKEVLPFCFATNGNKYEWRYMGLAKPRPVYNLHLLFKNPNATVIVVEGEKTADAVQSQLDPAKTVVVTWFGGAYGINNTDWSVLQGRKVIFWPDHDTQQKYGKTHPKAGQIKPWYEQPGNHAMLAIHAIIQDIITFGRWVEVPEEFPEKWDGADKEWKSGELKEFVLSVLTDVPEVEEVIDSIPAAPENNKILEAPKNPPLPALPSVVQERRSSHPIEDYFRLLGYDKGENGGLVFFFFSYDAKMVIKLSPSSMNKSNLKMLAPINKWEEYFPGKSTKFDIDQAEQFLISHSHAVGIFKESFIRGRGAWFDDGKFIIHTGDILLIGGELIPLKNHKSRYLYEIGERLGFGTSQPLDAKQASQLIDKSKFLSWDREISAYLLAGWCVIAPFCGILTWRPHIWVTGPAGSGKSWVMDNMVKVLLGETPVVVQGKTTEAGIRGILQNDARPVLFDEADVDGINDKERIQNILAMARASSSKDGGVVGKGTQSGGSRTYEMRSCYAFSSISILLKEQNDRSRFTMLSLTSFEDKKTKQEFLDFDKSWRELVTDDFVKSLQSRTIGLLPIIMKNSRTFADAVAHVIGQRRTGDQVGGMLAGAWSLVSNKEISFEKAVEWVKDRDWNEERSLESTKDELQLFSKLMGHITKIESNQGQMERSIGELILAACGKLNMAYVSAETSSDRLKRLGFIVKDDRIMISNTADGIKNVILKGSVWEGNHHRILARIPGAIKIEAKTYAPGTPSARGISLPLSMIVEAVEKEKEPEKIVEQSQFTFISEETDPELPF